MDTSSSSAAHSELADRLQPLTELVCGTIAAVLRSEPLSLAEAVEQASFAAPAPPEDAAQTRLAVMHGYQLVYALLASPPGAAGGLQLVHTPQAPAQGSTGPGQDAPSPSPASTSSAKACVEVSVSPTVVIAHWVWVSLWCWAEAMCRASHGLLQFPPLDRDLQRPERGSTGEENATTRAVGETWGDAPTHSLRCPFLTPSVFEWGANAASSADAASWHQLVRATQGHWRATVVPTSAETGTVPSASSKRDRRLQQLHALVTLCEHYRRLESFLTVALMRLDQCVVDEQSSSPLRRWQQLQDQKQQKLQELHGDGSVGAGTRLAQPSRPAYQFAPVGGSARQRVGLSAASKGAMTLSRRLLSAVMGRLLTYNASLLVEPALLWSVRHFLRRAHVLDMDGGGGEADGGEESAHARQRRHKDEVFADDTDDDDDREEEEDMLNHTLDLASAPASQHCRDLPRSGDEGSETAPTRRDIAWRRRRYTAEVNLKRLSRILRVLEDCRVRSVLAWVRRRVCAVCTYYGQGLSRLLLSELAEAPPMTAATLLQLWPLAQQISPRAEGEESSVKGEGAHASEVVRAVHGFTVIDASRALRDAIQGYVRLRACLLYLMAGTAHILDDVTPLGRRCVLSGLSHFLDGFSSGEAFTRFVARWGVPLWRQLCEGTFRMSQEALGAHQNRQSSGDRANRRSEKKSNLRAGEDNAADARGQDGGDDMAHDVDDAASATHTATSTLHSYGEAYSQSTVNIEHQWELWRQKQLSQSVPGQHQQQQQRRPPQQPQGPSFFTAAAQRGPVERDASSVWWADGGEDGQSQVGSRAGGRGALSFEGAGQRPANVITDHAGDDSALDRFELHEVATLPADGFPSLIYLLSRKENVRRRTLGVLCDQVRQFFLLSLHAEEKAREAANEDAAVKARQQLLDRRLLPPRTFRACVLALKTTMDSFDGLYESQIQYTATSSNSAEPRGGSRGRRGDQSGEVAVQQEARGMINAADEDFGLAPTPSDVTRGDDDEVDDDDSASSSSSSQSSERRGRVRDVVGGAEDDDDRGGEDADQGLREAAAEETPWAALLDYHRHRRRQQQTSPRRPHSAYATMNASVRRDSGHANTDAHGRRLYTAVDVAHMSIYKGIALFFADCPTQAAYTLAQSLSLRVEQNRQHTKREAAALLLGGRTRAQPQSRGGVGAVNVDAGSTAPTEGTKSHQCDAADVRPTTTAGDAASSASGKTSQRKKLGKEKSQRGQASPRGIAHVPSAQDDGIDLLIALISLLPNKELFMAYFLQQQTPHLLRLKRVEDLDYEMALRRRLLRQLGTNGTNPYTVLLRDVRMSFESPYVCLMARLDGHVRRHARHHRARSRRACRDGADVDATTYDEDGALITDPRVTTVLSSAVSHWSTPAPTETGSIASLHLPSEQSVRLDSRGRPIGVPAEEEENEDIRRARIFLGIEMERAPAALISPVAATTPHTAMPAAAASPLPTPVPVLKEAARAPFLLRRVRLLCRSWWPDRTDLCVSAAWLRRQYERGHWWSEAIVDAVLRVEWYVRGAGQGQGQTEDAARLLAAWDRREQQRRTTDARPPSSRHVPKQPAHAYHSDAGSIASSLLTGLDGAAYPARGGGAGEAGFGISASRSSLPSASSVSAYETHGRSSSGINAVEWVSASVASLPSRLLRTGTSRAAAKAPASTRSTTDQRFVTYPGYGSYCLLCEEAEADDDANDNGGRAAQAVRGHAAKEVANRDAAVAQSVSSAPSITPSALSRTAVVQGFSSVISTAVQQSNQLYGSLRRTGAALGLDASALDEDEEADLVEAYGGYLSSAARARAGSSSNASGGSAGRTASAYTAPAPARRQSAAYRTRGRPTATAPSTDGAPSDDGSASSLSFRAYSTGGLTAWSGVEGAATVTLPPPSHRAYRHVRWPLLYGELTFVARSLVGATASSIRKPSTETSPSPSRVSVTITGPPLVWLVLQALNRPRREGEEGGTRDAGAQEEKARRPARGGTFEELLSTLPVAVERAILAALLAQLVTASVVYRNVSTPKTANRRQYCYHIYDSFEHLKTHKVTIDLTDVLLQREPVPWFASSQDRHTARLSGAGDGHYGSQRGSPLSSFASSVGFHSSYLSQHKPKTKTAATPVTDAAASPTSRTATSAEMDAPLRGTSAETPRPARFAVEACVTRILKRASAPLTHQALYVQTQAHLDAHATGTTLTLTRDLFKQSLSVLIERQFIARDEEAGAYRFIP